MEALALAFAAFFTALPVTIPALFAYITRDQDLRWNDFGGLALGLAIWSGFIHKAIRPEFRAVVELGEPVMKRVTEDGTLMLAAFLVGLASYLITRVIVKPDEEELERQRLWKRFNRTNED